MHYCTESDTFWGQMVQKQNKSVGKLKINCSKEPSWLSISNYLRKGVVRFDSYSPNYRGSITRTQWKSVELVREVWSVSQRILWVAKENLFCQIPHLMTKKIATIMVTTESYKSPTSDDAVLVSNLKVSLWYNLHMLHKTNYAI